jgi:hypothetical protein
LKIGFLEQSLINLTIKVRTAIWAGARAGTAKAVPCYKASFPLPVKGYAPFVLLMGCGKAAGREECNALIETQRKGWDEPTAASVKMHY